MVSDGIGYTSTFIVREIAFGEHGPLLIVVAADRSLRQWHARRPPTTVLQRQSGYLQRMWTRCLAVPGGFQSAAR